MNLKKQAHDLTYRIENNFFLTVIRRSLTMMIPFVLVGGFACAFINLPFIDYGSELFDGALGTLYSIFYFYLQRYVRAFFPGACHCNYCKLLHRKK